MKSFPAGLVSGCFATVPMSIVMQILHHWPKTERESLPPHQITKRITSKIGARKHLNQTELKTLTLANHLGFGAAMGGLYAQLSSRLPGHPVVKGLVWGMVVWSVSYLGWLPAANILSPATEHSERRNFLMIVAHLVWGVITALMTDKLVSEERN